MYRTPNPKDSRTAHYYGKRQPRPALRRQRTKADAVRAAIREQGA